MSLPPPEPNPVDAALAAYIEQKIEKRLEAEHASLLAAEREFCERLTVEHEPQIAELKREVESLKTDHTAVGLQQFCDKLGRTMARCTELIDRLDRGPIELPSPLSARRSSSMN